MCIYTTHQTPYISTLFIHDALPILLYTSGSTGRPKGVVVPRSAVLHRVIGMQREYRLDASDRVLQKTPAGFEDRKSTRLNSSHQIITYAVFCLKNKNILQSQQ